MQDTMKLFAWYIAERRAMVGTNVFDGIGMPKFSQTHHVPERAQDLPSSNTRALV
ncbi:hypothetical protein [Alicyclobacillus sp. SO9]|uniref:hypothetical protein n=1 Tax=Alicyclobacillus sp. SO9 TaxID=2665646 RepID=UPI0018E802E2|nr:hypothetical protein [Alicyclobacillus sp. SO9]QQE78248.1 hypothetical protein GI364_20575 [Alicyclobacillus sp. SO9]